MLWRHHEEGTLGVGGVLRHALHRHKEVEQRAEAICVPGKSWDREL